MFVNQQGPFVEKDLKIKKIERLNLVLMTIRDVGKLLISENDRGKLIQGICDILVEKRGYYNAWIGLFDREKSIDLIAGSGMESRFEAVKKKHSKSSVFPVYRAHPVFKSGFFCQRSG